MAFPTIPLSEISPLSYNDPVLKSEHQKYLMQTRTRNIRAKRHYEVQWKGLTASEKNQIERFVVAQKGAVLPFAFTFPFGQTIIGATNANPIVITTQYAHNVLDLDLVIISGISGNAAANGTHQAHYLTPTTFQLIGVNGSGIYVSGGQVQLYFPSMLLIDNDMEFELSQKQLGPDKDNMGVWSVVLHIQEEYA